MTTNDKIDKVHRISINGIDYQTADLSPELQQIVSLYETTFDECKELEGRVQVLAFAMQQMGAILVQHIQAGEAKKAAALAATPPPSNVVPIIANTAVVPATGSANALS